MSPDGKYFAFGIASKTAREFTEASDIAILNLVSGEINYLTHQPSERDGYMINVRNDYPYWVHDGREILYSSDRGRTEKGGSLKQWWLEKIIRDNISIHPRTNDLEKMSFSISPNGMKIILSYGGRFEHNKIPIKNRKIYLMDWNGDNIKEIISKGWLASWETKRFISYMALNKQGKEETFIFDLETNQITKFSLHKVYTIWWPKG
ncbi:MAG TPA: hypothetical protein VJ024_06020 [Thermodesulfovibrionales bacterium]|nr:hypothetical protein [Thermodesulfovibrionales bacterium]